MPGAEWLLDTGPLVALLSARDAAHERCVQVIEQVRGELLTTEAVLTESLYLLRRAAGGPQACIDFFLRGGAILLPTTATRLARCRALMSTYASLPMDFADASLVTLAEELGVGRVLTLDRRGFTVYRWRKSKRFAVQP